MLATTSDFDQNCKFHPIVLSAYPQHSPPQSVHWDVNYYWLLELIVQRCVTMGAYCARTVHKVCTRAYETGWKFSS